jgi:hypothetical protein
MRSGTKTILRRRNSFFSQTKIGRRRQRSSLIWAHTPLGLSPSRKIKGQWLRLSATLFDLSTDNGFRLIIVC